MERTRINRGLLRTRINRPVQTQEYGRLSVAPEPSFWQKCYFPHWRDAFAAMGFGLVIVLGGLATWLLMGQIRKANTIAVVEPMECYETDVKVWEDYPRKATCVDVEEYIEIWLTAAHDEEFVRIVEAAMQRRG